MKKEIVLPFANPEFHIRKKGDQIHSPHPGTAVRTEDELYEITNYFFKDGKHFYILEPWDDYFTVRTIIEWNGEKEKKFIEECLREEKKKKKEKIAWAFQIFLGFLPANYQEKLEEKIGLNPLKATYWSSLFEFIFSISVLVLNFISKFTGVEFVPFWLVIICFFTVFEGFFRLVYSIASSEPIGSFLFAFLNLKIKGEKKIFEEDSYELIENGLIVETPYEKKHWEEWGGINYNNENYKLYKKIKKGNIFIYDFIKTLDKYPVIKIKDEKKYNSSSDASIIFALFWGFLEKDLQKEIEKFGKYDPFNYTKISIIFNLILSSTFISSRGFKLFYLKFLVFDFFVFIFSIILFVETIKRFIDFYGKKEITGSFLGFLFKPFYYIFFK